MDIKQFFQSISENLSASADVTKVYGDPKVVEGKTIIPVAKVSYGFGGGFGVGQDNDKSGDGGGGGGGVSASPVGVLEVTVDETRLIPFENKKKLVVAVIVGVLVGILLGKKLSRKKKASITGVEGKITSEAE